MRTFLGNETCRLVRPTLKVWLRVKAWFEGKGYSWVQVKGQGQGKIKMSRKTDLV